MSPHDPRAVERWFLDRGLPSVLTTAGRLRAVWPRSAPALSALATLSICGLTVYLLTGTTEIHIDAIDITTVEWIVLAVLGLALPLAAVVGWRVARMVTDRAQSIASTISVLIVVGSTLFQREPQALIVATVAIVAVLALTTSGIGSVLGWAGRLTLTQLAALGELTVGALPVVLLTVLVFFNTYVWIMAAKISTTRLWLLLAFLTAIATTFLLSRTLERAKPTLESATASQRHCERLAGTPFADMADPPEVDPLTRGERFNEVFILAASQIAQILAVAVVTAAIFLVMGLMILSPDVLDAWTKGGASDATVLGATVPVPQPLINMTLFLAALTYMYISARAVTDHDYRSRFLDSLLDDLKLTMIARGRYRYFHATRTPQRSSHPRSAPAIRLGR